MTNGNSNKIINNQPIPVAYAVEDIGLLVRLINNIAEETRKSI